LNAVGTGQEAPMRGERLQPAALEAPQAHGGRPSPESDTALAVVVIEQGRLVLQAMSFALDPDTRADHTRLASTAMARAGYHASDPLPGEHRSLLVALSRACGPVTLPHAASAAEWALVLCLHAEAVLDRCSDLPGAREAREAVSEAIICLVGAFPDLDVYGVLNATRHAGHFAPAWQHRELVPTGQLPLF
jgi:hypothetical protein